MEVYDQNAPLLVAQGYHPLPTAPADFQPAKAPVKWVPAYNKHVLFRGWAERTSPVLTPQPGANIGVRCGRGLVAFDYDEEEAALVISEAFDPSPVNKAGQRAWTPFYRADFDVPSEDFFDTAGKKVLQVLSTGRQTVIPPSIHPDTNEPYRWTNGQSLYDTPLADLPLLPRDYRERIMALGYSSKKSGPEQAERVDLETGEIKDTADNEWRALNNAALKNLAAWVPDLNLYKCRRRVGRFPNYEAIATWRESSTGRPLEERAPNLRISSTGIKDFGDGRTYTPIDLVMAARGVSAAEAFHWLDESLQPQKPEIEIDLEKIVQAQNAPPPGADNNKDALRPGSLDMTEEELALLGPVWTYGDPIPPEEPMLVPAFVPARPLLGFLGGQRSTFKTFVTNDLAVAIASGGEFAGQRVAYPGVVAQVELEGSLSKVRVTAAANHRGVKERLPILHFTKIPPPILINKRLNSQWNKWAQNFVGVIKRTAGAVGLPLALITMDPIMYFAGVNDNNSWDQWTDVCMALIKMAQAAGCPVLVVDHYGKDEDRGLVGSAAKEAAAHFMLGSSGERESRTGRELVVRKMKDGPAYICVDFDLDSYDVTPCREARQEDEVGGIEQQTHTTLVIKWGRELRAANDRSVKTSDGDHLSDLQRTAMIKLITLVNTEGLEIPSEVGAPQGMCGTQIERWFERLSRGRALGERGQSEANFKKLLLALQAKRQIEVHEPWVWVPLTVNSGGANA